MLETANSLDLRSEIDACMQSGSPELAALRINELWGKQSDLATAAFVCSPYEKLRDKLSLTPHRLAILHSFTVEPIVPLLRAGAFCSGIDLSVHPGDFNAYPQEILDSTSSLYEFSPDSAILAVRPVDIAPDLWTQSCDLPQEEMEKAY